MFGFCLVVKMPHQDFATVTDTGLSDQLLGRATPRLSSFWHLFYAIGILRGYDSAFGLGPGHKRIARENRSFPRFWIASSSHVSKP